MSLEAVVYHRCKRKCWFPSENRAIKHAKKSFDQHGVLLKAYPCYDCGGWHLAHPSYADLIEAQREEELKEKKRIARTQLKCLKCGLPCYGMCSKGSKEMVCESS